MTNITIFGVGLIGGSLALCFKGKPGIRVVGHSSSESSTQKYMKRNVVDYATTSMKEAAEGADFIFLCIPVSYIEQYLEKLNRFSLKPGCIVTDVGSTKSSIVQLAQTLFPQDVYFIGGHPMAGKESSGVEAATSLLFENAYYVLTPGSAVPQNQVDRLKELLKLTRAHTMTMDAQQHDEIVGAISHLPHIIAVALVNQIAGYNEKSELYVQLAAGGFRDITRIASSEPVVWRDILITNRDVMLKLLKDWNAEIEKFTAMLTDNDGASVEGEFKRANVFRSELPERRKGMISSLYEIYVDVPDHPGIIGQITTVLGHERINLSNIQIIESREDVPGVLRLSFRNETDMERAREILKEEYEVHI